jgi:hypothetical protein
MPRISGAAARIADPQFFRLLNTGFQDGCPADRKPFQQFKSWKYSFILTENFESERRSFELRKGRQADSEEVVGVAGPGTTKIGKFQNVINIGESDGNKSRFVD